MYISGPLYSGYPVMPLDLHFPQKCFMFLSNKPQKNCIRRFLSQGIFVISHLLPAFFCVEAPCYKHDGNPQTLLCFSWQKHRTSVNLDSFREADLWRPERQHTIIVKGMESRLPEFKPMACLLFTASETSGKLLSLCVLQFPHLYRNMRM